MMATKKSKLHTSVVDHPLFPQIAQLYRVEEYARDGGHKNPRKRLELKTTHAKPKLIRDMLDMQVACVRCGEPIHPFRARVKGSSDRTELPRHIYCAVSCPLDVDIGCSRGKAARDEYIKIVKAIDAELGK
jgi:hypothetical protein